jgi:hypothetical protein
LKKQKLQTNIIFIEDGIGPGSVPLNLFDDAYLFLKKEYYIEYFKWSIDALQCC